MQWKFWLWRDENEYKKGPCWVDTTCLTLTNKNLRCCFWQLQVVTSTEAAGRPGVCCTLIHTNYHPWWAELTLLITITSIKPLRNTPEEKYLFALISFTSKTREHPIHDLHIGYEEFVFVTGTQINTTLSYLRQITMIKAAVMQCSPKKHLALQPHLLPDDRKCRTLNRIRQSKADNTSLTMWLEHFLFIFCSIGNFQKLQIMDRCKQQVLGVFCSLFIQPPDQTCRAREARANGVHDVIFALKWHEVQQMQI